MANPLNVIIICDESLTKYSLLKLAMASEMVIAHAIHGLESSRFSCDCACDLFDLSCDHVELGFVIA